MINVKLDRPELMPKKSHPTDAGFDLIANKLLKVYDENNELIDKSVDLIIPPHGRALIGTGVFLEIPEGWYADVVSRSGLSINKGIEVLNSPGIIDANYRGEVGVILHNTSSQEIRIEKGSRIAQLIFHKLEQVELNEVLLLTDTDRGSGGFGSTGI